MAAVMRANHSLASCRLAPSERTAADLSCVQYQPQMKLPAAGACDVLDVPTVVPAQPHPSPDHHAELPSFSTTVQCTNTAHASQPGNHILPRGRFPFSFPPCPPLSVLVLPAPLSASHSHCCADCRRLPICRRIAPCIHHLAILKFSPLQPLCFPSFSCHSGTGNQHATAHGTSASNQCL